MGKSETCSQNHALRVPKQKWRWLNRQFQESLESGMQEGKTRLWLSNQREIHSGVAEQASSWSNLSRFPPNGNTEHRQVRCPGTGCDDDFRP